VRVPPLIMTIKKERTKERANARALPRGLAEGHSQAHSGARYPEWVLFPRPGAKCSACPAQLLLRLVSHRQSRNCARAQTFGRAPYAIGANENGGAFFGAPSVDRSSLRLHPVPAAPLALARVSWSTAGLTNTRMDKGDRYELDVIARSCWEDQHFRRSHHLGTVIGLAMKPASSRTAGVNGRQGGTRQSRPLASRLMLSRLLSRKFPVRRR